MVHFKVTSFCLQSLAKFFKDNFASCFLAFFIIHGTITGIRANTLEGIQKIGFAPEPEDTENDLMGDYNNEEE